MIMEKKDVEQFLALLFLNKIFMFSTTATRGATTTTEKLNEFHPENVSTETILIVH